MEQKNCYVFHTLMSLKDYIHKIQQKPVRERERIAVIWTAIGFSIILLIWIVSFREMNKPVETQADQTSASLNDLKTNFQEGKDSIQDMMQELPNQTGADGSLQNLEESAKNNQEKAGVPQLP